MGIEKIQQGIIMHACDTYVEWPTCGKREDVETGGKFHKISHQF